MTDPISFAGKHRIHHKYADNEGDVHSPHGGFWFCWFGSLFDDGCTDEEIQAMARDLTKFPELAWLPRFFWVPRVALGAATYALGVLSMFAIGFCSSRAMIIHGASAVNYFCHVFGTQRYATGDKSRDNALVALLTFGEGWHNNHHHFPAAARGILPVGS